MLRLKCNTDATDVLDPSVLNSSFNNEFMIINLPFDLDEIQFLIKGFKKNKTRRYDTSINEFLESPPYIMINIIVSLFLIVLKTGKIPDDCCVWLIKPIYKIR